MHPPAPGPSFSSLGLSAELGRALTEAGYLAPTPVQEWVIPLVLRGGDVIATAATGSGKTAAFVLPILQAFDARPRGAPRSVRALILVPTRELGAQIAGAIRIYGAHLKVPVKTVLLSGGGSLNPQRMALRGGADIVVATPGRLLDLANEKAVFLGTISTLVLDEADRLLALGFADELGSILALLPARRQSVLVSATFPAAVDALAKRLLHEPTRVEAASAAPAPAIEQRAVVVDRARRTQLLLHLLEDASLSRVLVFVSTKYGVDHLTRKLTRAGVAARAIHGDLGQGARTEALAAFKAAAVRVLVATDVAARGLDIPAMPWVVNFDLPRSPADYLHRIGRTGRAGETGTALTFVCPDDEAHFRLIEKRHALTLLREAIPGFEPAIAKPSARVDAPAATGGVKGKRRSKKDKLRAGLPPFSGGR